MRFFLPICLCALAVAAQAATGDVSGARTDGISLYFGLSGMATNGTFTTGLGGRGDVTNAVTGNERGFLIVSSPGYDNTGASNLVTRKVLLTLPMRFPAGGEAYNDQTNVASVVTNRMALSDFVYAGDTATVTLAPGLYVAGGVSNTTATAQAVVNLSDLPYPEVHGYWVNPEYRKVSANTMTLEFACASPYGTNGLPMACVRFIVYCDGTSVTNTQTQLVRQEASHWLFPIYVYRASFDISAFTQAAPITCDVECYPWVGNTNSVLRTAYNSTAFGAIRWWAVSATNLCDRLGTYAPTIAVVDRLNGNDTNGRVTNTTPENVLSGHYFATIANAIYAVQGTNGSLYGHNNAGGSTIYLKAGTTNWTGATFTINKPVVVLTVASYPGETNTISFQSGTYNPGNIFAISNMIFSAGNYICYQTERVILQNCRIDTVGGPITEGVTNLWLVDCDIRAAAGQSLRLSGNKPQGIHYRNCWFNGWGQAASFQSMMGSYRITTNGLQFSLVGDVASPGVAANRLFMYGCFFGGLHGNAMDHLTFGNNYTVSNGFALVNSVFEYATNTGANPAQISLCTGNVHTTNGLVQNCDFLGMKWTVFYNDNGSAPYFRKGIHVQGCIVTDINCKGDLFTTANAGRTGNWACIFGVGWSGNAFLETTNLIAAGDFVPEFCGLETIGYNYGRMNTCPRRPSTYPKFVGPKFWDGSSTNEWGVNGDYRLLPSSPLQRVISRRAVGWSLGPIPSTGGRPGALDTMAAEKGSALFGL